MGLLALYQAYFSSLLEVEANTQIAAPSRVIKREERQLWLTNSNLKF
jgi:hypothetical protein